MRELERARIAIALGYEYVTRIGEDLPLSEYRLPLNPFTRFGRTVIVREIADCCLTKPHNPEHHKRAVRRLPRDWRTARDEEARRIATEEARIWGLPQWEGFKR